MHYVYLLQSVSVPGRKYVGYSDDLRRRLSNHNLGRNASTAAARPWRLQTYVAFSTKAHALAFEGYLKSGSGHAFARKRLWHPPAQPSPSGARCDRGRDPVAARFSGAGGIAREPDPAAAAFAFDARTGAEPVPFGGNHFEALAVGERGDLGRDAPLVGATPDEEDTEQQE